MGKYWTNWMNHRGYHCTCSVSLKQPKYILIYQKIIKIVMVGYNIKQDRQCKSDCCCVIDSGPVCHQSKTQLSVVDESTMTKTKLNRQYKSECCCIIDSGQVRHHSKTQLSVWWVELDQYGIMDKGHKCLRHIFTVHCWPRVFTNRPLMKLHH